VLVESALARRFSASKTPVREALALLQQDQLIEALPRRGYLVRPITVQDVHELFELRGALEGAAAEMAATRITPDELQHLENLLLPPQLEVQRNAIRSLLDRNKEFHLSIAKASRNERLVRLIERTIDEMARLIVIGYETGEHAEIVAALRSGSSDRARSVVLTHLVSTQERVLKRETAGFAPPHWRSAGGTPSGAGGCHA
jgi:DNA-binding GntR family transcriptional regulator